MALVGAEQAKLSRDELVCPACGLAIRYQEPVGVTTALATYEEVRCAQLGDPEGSTAGARRPTIDRFVHAATHVRLRSLTGMSERGDAITLDHVVLAVSDWERSNAFYRDVCRAELIRLDDPPPTRWRYRFGDINLNAHGPGMAPDPVARIPTEPGMADLCLVWPGTADAAVQHLSEHGVPVEQGPVPRNGAAGPGVSVYFRDPDGSLLEFISYAAKP